MSLTDIVLVVLFLIGLVVLVQAGRSWLKYRGTMVVTCPETRTPVATRVDAVHAAFASALNGHHLRLRACTRWPERHDCGQECLKQIEPDPEACRVRTLASEWYAGKTCVYCHTALDGAGSIDQPYALLLATGQTRLWSDVPADQLPVQLHFAQPVCWNCHIIERFRRQYPELVVEAGAVEHR